MHALVTIHVPWRLSRSATSNQKIPALWPKYEVKHKEQLDSGLFSLDDAPPLPQGS